MKNRLSNLNDHLFAQIERLSDEDMTVEDVDREVKRADAIVSLSDQIISNAGVQLKAAKLFGEYGASILPHLPQVGKAETPRAIEGKPEE